MNEAARLELHYAARLRRASAAERRSLYSEAYSEVGKLRTFVSTDPEDRTAGTSRILVDQIDTFLGRNDNVLEIGCGRGYTAMMLAPRVRRYIGTEVSIPSILEARQLMHDRFISNAEIVDVSAIDLSSSFPTESFDSAVSIEVVEHLHRDDAIDHIKQVFTLLKPGGVYIVCMPNKLDGPHDVTRIVYPESTEALGFHLYESTHKEIIEVMSSIGFNRFRTFRSLMGRVVKMPACANYVFERLYARKVLRRFTRRLLTIQLAAWRPKLE